jgi:hypothetical protein
MLRLDVCLFGLVCVFRSIKCSVNAKEDELNETHLYPFAPEVIRDVAARNCPNHCTDVYYGPKERELFSEQVALIKKKKSTKLKTEKSKYSRTIRIKIHTSESERSKSSIMSACVGDVYPHCKFEKSKKFE